MAFELVVQLALEFLAAAEQIPSLALTAELVVLVVAHQVISVGSVDHLDSFYFFTPLLKISVAKSVPKRLCFFKELLRLQRIVYA